MIPEHLRAEIERLASAYHREVAAEEATERAERHRIEAYRILHEAGFPGGEVARIVSEWFDPS